MASLLHFRLSIQFGVYSILHLAGKLDAAYVNNVDYCKYFFSIIGFLGALFTCLPIVVSYVQYMIMKSLNDTTDTKSLRPSIHVIFAFIALYALLYAVIIVTVKPVYSEIPICDILAVASQDWKSTGVPVVTLLANMGAMTVLFRTRRMAQLTLVVFLKRRGNLSMAQRVLIQRTLKLSQVFYLVLIMSCSKGWQP